MNTRYNILVGGKAGEGVDVTARLIAELAMANGWFYFLNSEFHNAIKGCHNFFQINICSEKVLSHNLSLDLVIALDHETLQEDLKYLKPNGLVIHDSGYELSTPIQGVKYFSVPIRELAKTMGGDEIMKNVVCIGLMTSLLQVDLSVVKDLIAFQFKNKNQDIIKANLNSLRAGYEYAEKFYIQNKPFDLKKIEIEKRISVSGNVMSAQGAIKAGCKFFSAYPMTPSSSILHYMAEHAKENVLSVHHVEDELAAINMAIGASYAGTRAMTATSGGGYALMSEALGFAGTAEIPVVIVEVQRPGPSTGLPTRTGQGDLRQALHAGQGIFPHIVLAPGTIQEAFDLTFEAFNLADIYQCPVTVLMDKYLGESWMCINESDRANLSIDRGKFVNCSSEQNDFRRYRLEPDGISERCLPGQADGKHVETSYEHDEEGFFSEKPEAVTAMNDKRMNKLLTCQKSLPPVVLYGPSDADITLVLWGSTFGPASEALDLLKNEGIKANILQIKYLNPLQQNLSQIFANQKRLILVEGNYSAELGGILREKIGVEVNETILNYSGRPFSPEEICERVKNIVK